MKISTRGRTLLMLAAGAVAGANLVRATLRRRRVRGKLAVVTGGSRGLGLRIAARLGQRGATVAICARDGAELERAARKLAAEGVVVSTYVVDVTDAAAVRHTMAQIDRDLGAIDLVVNNAGILHIGPATAMTHDDLRAAMETNFWGAVHVADAVLPSMIARGDGHLVNIGSIGGITQIPWMLPYSASKAAIVGWSKGLHHDLAREGVAVTTVAPWVMRTGGPVNATFKGSARRGAFLALALADITPGLAIGADAAARTIVRGIEARRSMVFVGLRTRAIAALEAMMPNVVGASFALLAAALPSSKGDQTGGRGRELAGTLGAAGRTIAERSRSRNNQPSLPARSAPAVIAAN